MVGYTNSPNIKITILLILHPGLFNIQFSTSDFAYCCDKNGVNATMVTMTDAIQHDITVGIKYLSQL